MEAVFEIVGVLSLGDVSALLGAGGCQQKFDSRILCRRLPEFVNYP